jgi:Mg-chelatase subunit ChlD
MSWSKGPFALLGACAVWSCLASCSADGDAIARDGNRNPFGNAGASKGEAGAGARSARNPAQIELGQGEVCDADSYSAERKRLDIYMVVDDSASMVPWWPFTLDAISQFLHDADSAGIGVGLQFFGNQCDPAFYANPRVPIAELPDAAPALEMAFPALPLEGTAMVPALQGAVQYARDNMDAHRDSKTVVLLVTDGLPTECNSNVPDVEAAAMMGLLGSPSVQTFVIGIGIDLTTLDGFAKAGGSDKAFSVEPGSPAALVDALNAIRGQALPCDYALPTGDSSVDVMRVNLRHTSASGEVATIGWVSGPQACDPQHGGGWYFDDPSAPQRLIVCPDRCDQLKQAGGEVQVLLGCPRVEVDVQ